MDNENILSEMFFLFIFMYILFYFKIPNIQSYNIIKHKLFIFIAVFIFTIASSIIKKIKKQCIININEIIIEAFCIGSIALIAYSLYVDLKTMDWSKQYFNFSNINNKNNELKIYGIVTFFITFCILIVRTIILLFSKKTIEC
jgi:hypothetical protein